MGKILIQIMLWKALVVQLSSSSLAGLGARTSAVNSFFFLVFDIVCTMIFDPYFCSIFFHKIYQSVFLCEDMPTFFPFAIVFPFNGPTGWIFYACCFCSSWRITSWEPFLATHTFVFGHRSWIGCLRLLWWVSCRSCINKKATSQKNDCKNLGIHVNDFLW